MSGKIIINTERCKGCGLCVAVCPKKSIVISKESNKNGYFPAEATNVDCTGCASCAIICPEAVIEVIWDGEDNPKIVTKSYENVGRSGPERNGTNLIEEKK